MIPLRLHLHNFLSYGDSCEPIDFDGVHVACLCGPNGHGKSALLDGITWAIWGQARSNSAADLIRLQQPSMFVELEFLLDRQRYRVVRKWSRSRSGQSDLQFQSQAEDGQWRALTGQGVRGTQERINTALRMDYDTFINSAFLVQGRADEFARKTPGDRKKILGEILSLGIYDQLSEAARARRADAGMRVNALEAEIRKLEGEYARLPDLRASVERFTGEHGAAQLAVAEARAKHGEVMVEKMRLDARRRERDDLDRRLRGAEEELKTLRGGLAAARARVEAAQGLIVREAEIRARAAELLAVSRERDEMMGRLMEAQALEEGRSRVQRQLQEARHALEKQLHLHRQKVRELKAQADQLPYMEQQVRDLQEQAAALDRLQDERSALLQRLPEAAAEIAGAQAEQRRCMEELEKADERFRLLKGANAVCPLCEGELPEAKRKDLGWKLREEKAGWKEAQVRALQREADGKRLEAETRRRVQELDQKLKTGQHMRDRLAQAQQKALDLEAAAKDLPLELEAAQALEAQLAAGEFAPELTAQLAEVEARLQGLSYDRGRHQALAERAKALSGADRALEDLQRAESGLPEELRQVESLETAIRAREEAIAEDVRARHEADRDLSRAPAVEAEVAGWEKRVNGAEAAERDAGQRLGAAKQALEECEGLAAQLAERKREREAAANEQADYEELAKAFGRNGIQALIIENALPEIEEEANALLSRMSEGELNVRLKTQRELRAGGQAETLEIEISDGVGARRYELYSGGEAFRVNFALRIALSKLLAKRAGARLETLFVDEGFGSQDQDGRQRLVEAIRAVQEDFGRILVITHIDELKDAFPTRIEVTKSPSGSQVAVY